MAVCLLILGLQMTVGNAEGEKGTMQEEKKPAVGIAWRRDQTSESFVCTVEAVRAAGGTPVLLPMVKASFFQYEEGRLRGCTEESGQLSPEASAKVRAHSWQDSDALQVMQGVSAIVFPGGEDISPSLYAKPQVVEAREGFSPERDVSDFLLMSLCLEKDVPVLALCRGCQVLSVVSGAEMIQDIPAYLERRGIRHAHEHRNEPPSLGAYRDFAFHDVRVVEKDSLLYRIVDREVIPKAPSWHHQAVGSVEGTPLRVTGVFEAPGTELIEAVERPDKAFVLGLQFHPEIAVVRGLDETSILYFRAIVEAADGR